MWADVINKGGKLTAAVGREIYTLSEKESDEFRNFVINGGVSNSSKNNSIVEKLQPKGLRL